METIPGSRGGPGGSGRDFWRSFRAFRGDSQRIRGDLFRSNLFTLGRTLSIQYGICSLVYLIAHAQSAAKLPHQRHPKTLPRPLQDPLRRSFSHLLGAPTHILNGFLIIFKIDPRGLARDRVSDFGPGTSPDASRTPPQAPCAR